MKKLSSDLLASLVSRAAESPRGRKNYNFHDDPTERVQRFINVLQPGTYIRPHRHKRPSDRNGFEFFLVLQGELGLLVLDDAGQILEGERISPQGLVHGIELAEGTCHTLIALVPNTVVLEVKEGPYDPATDKEFLEIFPSEGSLEATRQVEIWQSYFA